MKTLCRFVLMLIILGLMGTISVVWMSAAFAAGEPSLDKNHPEANLILTPDQAKQITKLIDQLTDQRDINKSYSDYWEKRYNELRDCVGRQDPAAKVYDLCLGGM